MSAVLAASARNEGAQTVPISHTVLQKLVDLGVSNRGEFSGPQRHHEGGVGARLAQAQGQSSPPAFMGLMKMAERTSRP